MVAWGKDLHQLQAAVELADSFAAERNRTGEAVCLGDHEVSRNTLPGSVEGSLSLVLPAHRDGNCEVTSPGCLEADEVPVLCKAVLPRGMETNVGEELCTLWRDWNSLLLCRRAGLEAAVAWASQPVDETQL